ncbi:uncharacterized protein LOC124260141 [Haliotis rubra]|uniref:uncharacterized protein LOC124260141 n=1 Tax=Haliotis rubra TaxID=36100 RepID=UPI001EE6151A|nr:uncharacterized protein LOC124260141 [Haliotis rubra]
MAAIIAILFSCIALYNLAGCTYTPPTFYFDQECGKTITFTKDMLLDFTENTTEADWSAMSCNVVVMTEELSQRLLITPLHLNITTSYPCNETSLNILNSDAQPLNNPPWICGQHLSRPTLNTSGVYSWWEYQKDEGVTEPGGFKFLVSSFRLAKDGFCGHHEYHCSNDNCVSNDVICNSYNDCGDNSDETVACRPSIFEILIISLGGILCLVTVAAVIVVIRRRRRGRSQYKEIQ